MKLSLKVLDQDHKILTESSAQNETHLFHRQDYDPGDSIHLYCELVPTFLMISFDATLPTTLVYVTENTSVFPIPFAQRRQAHAPLAFQGRQHRMTVRRARESEIYARRNLALNPHDLPENNANFPHATANVETRDEAVFYARNAIDGEHSNVDHGKWPFTSWGINCDENAALTVNFGRPVQIDEVVIYLRADFPHDAWWQSARLCLSNGETLALEFEKTGAAQSTKFSPQVVEWARLDRLIKAPDPSLYPALTQIELWGSQPSLDQTSETLNKTEPL